MSIEEIRAINIAVGILGLMIGIVATATGSFFAQKKDREWSAFAQWRRIWIINMIAMAMDVISNYTSGLVSMISVAAKHSVEFGAFIVNYTMLVWFAESLMESLGEERVHSLWLKICYLIGFFYTILLLWSRGSRWLYWIDEQNVYHRGEYFYIMWIACAIIEFGNIFLIIRKRKQLDKVVFLSYSMMGISTTVATIMQMLFFGVSLIYISISLAILLIYVVTQNDLYERLYRKERELSENRMQAMVSQLQPHFLYNALTAIMAIEGTPPETRDAIRDFAGYLRGNLDSLQQVALIPFDQELKHVRTYLNLEKLRFGEKLHISMKIEATQFQIPPLSVQMLVENAVKHGIHPKDGSGTISLNVREMMGYYEICIEDDGIGFNLAEKQEDGRSHLGLQNVSYRIQTQVNGSMKIDSVPGIGTRVYLFIPMEE